jgi:hypothetical protein
MFCGTSYLGLPTELLLCFAVASTIRDESATLEPDVVKARGERIVRYVRRWTPPLVPEGQDTVDSISHIMNIATMEMWRHVRFPLPLSYSISSSLS